MILVQASKELWGRAMRHVAGAGEPCVKAYLGPLPPGQSGYTFMTEVAPTRPRSFWGTDGVVWEEGSAGVFPVEEDRGYVKIAVEVINDRT